MVTESIKSPSAGATAEDGAGVGPSALHVNASETSPGKWRFLVTRYKCSSQSFIVLSSDNSYHLALNAYILCVQNCEQEENTKIHYGAIYFACCQYDKIATRQKQFFGWTSKISLEPAADVNHVIRPCRPSPPSTTNLSVSPVGPRLTRPQYQRPDTSSLAPRRPNTG